MFTVGRVPRRILMKKYETLLDIVDLDDLKHWLGKMCPTSKQDR